MANNARGIGRLLSPEKIAKIQKSKEELVDVKATMEVLKRMGMDVSPIEDKLKWIEQMQDIVLEEFKKE